MIKLTNHTTVAALAFMSLLFGGSACKRSHDSTGLEFAPQMYDAVGYEPYRQVRKNEINPQGLNMRMPAAGTVARPNYRGRSARQDPRAPRGPLRRLDR